MTHSWLAHLLLALLLGACARSSSSEGASVREDREWPTYESVSVDARGFVVDGRYQLLRGGSLQWFRLPEEVWEDRLRRFRAAGFNTVDMYVPWNLIEPEEGVFQFDRPNMRRFLELARAQGLYVYVRPGPYITNEMDGGGLPAWLTPHTTKTSVAADGRLNLRTNDPDYLAAVARYLDALNAVIRPYLITNGGPIVLYAIENEYDWFELFHEVDKLFWYEGGTERPVFQQLDTEGYLAALRDLVRADGIDVPITTCPGDARVAGMGDVSGVIPMPNIYKQGRTEAIAYDIVTSMHDPGRFGGSYVDYPSGSTETARTASRMQRLLLGGMDASFAFNVVGTHTPGYGNALVMSSAGLSAFLDVQLDEVLDAFVSPTVGYFHNVIDYDGAIGPSGTLREKFFAFRRANLLFDAFETPLAAVLHPRRSGAGLPGGDPRLSVDHPAIGADENGRRVHTWLDAGGGTYFIGLVNETGVDQLIPPAALHIDGELLPRYTSLAIAPERDSGREPGGGAPLGGSPETDYAHMLVVGAELSPGLRLRYSTSEVLTLRDFGDARLLVLYGVPGSEGELAIDGLADLLSAGPGIELREQSASHLVVSYRHEGDAFLSLRTHGGRTITVVITTRERAGRFWFFEVGDEPLLVAGLDLVTLAPAGLELAFEHAGERARVLVMGASAVALKGLLPVSGRDPVTGAAYYDWVAHEPVSFEPLSLGRGRIRTDRDESFGAASSGDWIAWDGAPRPLEQLGIPTGHAWYVAELEIEGSPGQRWGGWPLKIEHASDIVGIYVNGHYVTTLSPLGTEIDNRSWSNNYAFPDVTPYLVAGRNTLAFRVDVWGHGSFMWPRGTLIPTKAALPSLGYDAYKGLWGRAELGGQPLSSWRAREGLAGERRGWPSAELDESQWRAATAPLQLEAGDVTWYRASFSSAALPDPRRYHAPVVLSLAGRNAKATIYLNGRLIGRWLSDVGWLERGSWARPVRDMWTSASPDEFPVPIETLAAGSDLNHLAVVFEDASGPGESPGRIQAIELRLAHDERGHDGDGMARVPMRGEIGVD